MSYSLPHTMHIKCKKIELRKDILLLVVSILLHIGNRYLPFNSRDDLILRTKIFIEIMASFGLVACAEKRRNPLKQKLLSQVQLDLISGKAQHVLPIKIKNQFAINLNLETKKTKLTSMKHADIPRKPKCTQCVATMGEFSSSFNLNTLVSTFMSLYVALLTCK